MPVPGHRAMRFRQLVRESSPRLEYELYQPQLRENQDPKVFAKYVLDCSRVRLFQLIVRRADLYQRVMRVDGLNRLRQKIESATVGIAIEHHGAHGVPHSSQRTKRVIHG